MLVDDEKAHIVGTQEQNGHMILTIRTIACDEFAVVRPELSEETEQLLLEKIRKIVDEEEENKGSVDPLPAAQICIPSGLPGPPEIKSLPKQYQFPTFREPQTAHNRL